MPMNSEKRREASSPGTRRILTTSPPSTLPASPPFPEATRYPECSRRPGEERMCSLEGREHWTCSCLLGNQAVMDEVLIHAANELGVFQNSARLVQLRTPRGRGAGAREAQCACATGVLLNANGLFGKAANQLHKK